VRRRGGDAALILLAVAVGVWYWNDSRGRAPQGNFPPYRLRVRVRRTVFRPTQTEPPWSEDKRPCLPTDPKRRPSATASRDAPERPRRQGDGLSDPRTASQGGTTNPGPAAEVRRGLLVSPCACFRPHAFAADGPTVKFSGARWRGAGRRRILLTPYATREPSLASEGGDQLMLCS
jgi:hypothetical protein